MAKQVSQFQLLGVDLEVIVLYVYPASISLNLDTVEAV